MWSAQRHVSWGCLLPRGARVGAGRCEAERGNLSFDLRGLGRATVMRPGAAAGSRKFGAAAPDAAEDENPIIVSGGTRVLLASKALAR